MGAKPENYPQNPPEIWERFYEITQIPRPSRKEEKIRNYIIDLANVAKVPHKVDAEGNIVLYLPATSGYEDHGTVIIQNHIDMVTVKTNDKVHNFDTDPLDLVVEDGWLKADRTTLGSDNGLGCAAALALLTDKDVKHPPLEILFTVDEETGLNGATNLDGSLLSGKRMLNLDTEDWGELFIGCAGGLGYEMNCGFDTTETPSKTKAYKLELRGLAGGHSGIQINEQHGNANKLIAELFTEANRNNIETHLTEMNAGIAHNVIPREADLVFYANEQNVAKLNELVDASLKKWKSYLPKVDHSLSISVQQTTYNHAPLSQEAQGRLLRFMSLFPHGAVKYNLNQPADLVDLSSNFSVLKLHDGEVKVIMSLRFFNREEAVGLDQQIVALGETFGFEMEQILDYPSWTPDFENPMLEFTQNIYEELYGEKPAIKAIHAGLECGIIKDKLGKIDIISFGPTIKGAHSPSERIKIDTVEPFYKLFKVILERM